MSELDQLRQEAEQLKNQIRVHLLCIKLKVLSICLNDRNDILYKYSLVSKMDYEK